jgi:glycerophosphoryl diester phosphodiesterase
MPENTFSSFDLAVRMGADMIELDVHQTKDERLVVIHDDTVDRTTDGTGRISTMTFLELEHLNAAAKSKTQMHEPIPPFSGILERYSNRIPLMVEVKHGSSVYPGIEQRVIETLKLHKALDEVELISFDIECLQNLRKASSMAKLGFIFIGNLASFADLLGDEVDAFHGMHNFILRSQIDHVRSMGRPSFVWTVNSEEEIRDAIRLGPDGIVSNYPDRVLNALGRT